MNPCTFQEQIQFSIRRAGIITKKNDRDAIQFATQLERWLQTKTIQVSINTIVPELDILIILGGDGTLLHVAEQAARHSIPILGINMGSLGFLTELAEHETKQALRDILNGPVTIENRMMLKVRLVRENGAEPHRLALNEVVLSKDAIDRILNLSTSADKTHITNYKADGLIFSTPTGSTAYNLSAGGPLVYPGLASILVTPICPFMLGSRPILLPAEAKLSTQVIDREQQSSAKVIIDGQPTWSMSVGERLEVETAKRHLQLIISSQKDYFSILRNKLHWGNRKE